MIILFFFILSMFIYRVGDGKELRWDYVLVLVLYGCLLLIVPFKQLLYITVSVNDDWDSQRQAREKYSYIDFYSIDYSVDEWLNYLVDESCTYLYLHEVNDYFIAKYVEAFESTDSIEIHNMYKIVATPSDIKLVSIN